MTAPAGTLPEPGSAAIPAGRPERATRSRRPGWSARRRRLGAAVLTLPAWVLLLTLFAVPIAVGVYLSFRNEAIGSFARGRFVGFSNFRRDVFTSTFYDAVKTTAVIALMGLAIQLPAGIGLALLLHRNLRGTRFFRSALLIPMLLTPVAVGIMWRFMLDSDLGVMNWLLQTVGLGHVDWLGDQHSAVVAIVLVDSWQAIPFVMLLTLAGLAGLPESPMEAARVDGGSAWQTFWFVTFPMLRPVLYVILMIRVIDAAKLFDIIFILTRGGPGTATQTVGLLDYNTGFNFLQISRAAAIGVVLAVFTIPVYLLWTRAVRANK
ncbi:MAG: sugar ABC transporter permease [Acidimicrobiales bacterium]